jgi:hypothetical protein
MTYLLKFILKGLAGMLLFVAFLSFFGSAGVWLFLLLCAVWVMTKKSP